MRSQERKEGSLYNILNPQLVEPIAYAAKGMSGADTIRALKAPKSTIMNRRSKASKITGSFFLELVDEAINDGTVPRVDVCDDYDISRVLLLSEREWGYYHSLMGDLTADYKAVGIEVSEAEQTVKNNMCVVHSKLGTRSRDEILLFDHAFVRARRHSYWDGTYHNPVEDQILE